MSIELRNSLWSVLDSFVWTSEAFRWRRINPHRLEEGQYVQFGQDLWFQYFKQPTDERGDFRQLMATIRKYFFDAEWYEVYDFLEWVLNYRANDGMSTAVNLVLERELAGYRFVGAVFTDITDQQEVEALEIALADDRFAGVQAHLKASLQLLSDRRNPDYRNSIKESISAVESIAKEVSGIPKATLGDALAALEKRGQLHPALKAGFSSLYGYTSDEGGIRHAMLEEPDLDADDAKFFLLSCTSFINYLKSKLS